MNKKSGIRKPADLNGKRVGLQTWITSAALWAKGMLQDDHGVNLASIQWVAWQPVRIPDWRAPTWLKMEIAPKGTEQFDLLAQGSIDAGITTEIWAPNRHPDIDFLFPDYARVEREYYQRTKFFPIMHTLLVRTSVLEANPWVARSLFDAWQRSKEACYQQQAWQRIHQTALWYRGLWEEERAVGGEDFYAWGFKRSREELATLLRYSHEQALTPRLYAPEELFPATMLDT